MLHGDILGERARLTPERTALVVAATGQRLSYGELDGRAAASARAWLGELDLCKGDRIAILSNNRVEFLEAYFAAAKSGVILVPLGTKLTPKELEFILRDAGVKALLYAGSFAETVRVLQRCVELDHWIALDDPTGPGDERYAELHRRGSASSIPLPPCGAEDTCFLMYTSGTTGRPKGVIVPHRMISWNAMNTMACWQLRETDVSPVFTPLYHAGGIEAFIPPIFAIGGTIVLHDGFDAAEVLRTIESERCTVALGVPTIYRMLLDHPDFEKTDLSHLRWLISGGAPLPVGLVEEYRERGVVLRQGYGLTEVGVNCFAMSSDEAIAHAGAIGRPMMFTEARLVDEDGQDVEDGQVGELCLRGPHVSGGYWNNAQATAAAYDEQGYFHTGDLARRDEHGLVSIVGRRTDMYISGGVNVYPPEIEAELLLHEQVEDVAVVGVPHPKWGETGVAFVLPRAGAADRQEPLRESLSQLLRGRLAKYKLPRELVLVEELPRTAYGKVKKGELRQAYVDGAFQRGGPVATPSTEG